MFEIARPFLLALAIGLLIGIERERAKADTPENDPLGSRTFTLIALLGAAAAYVTDTAIAAILAAGVVAIVLAGYALTRLGEGGSSIGTTTEVAAIVTFVLGYLAHDAPWLAGMLAVLTLGMLALKPRIHAFAKAGISQQEMTASLTLLVIAFVILPLMPDRTIDPWNLIHPARLWLVVVLVAGISFGGYIAVRALGPRWGLPLAGLSGGFVSSTAATLSLARRAQEATSLATPAAVGIVLANVASAVAQIVIVAVVAPDLVGTVLPVLGLPVLAGLAGSAIVTASAETQETGTFEIGNPLAFRATVLFAGVLVAVLVIVSAAARMFGNAGLRITAVLGGTTDVHAVTLAVANLFRASDVVATQAVFAILLAFVANMAVKLGIAAWAGGRAVVVRVWPQLLAMVAASIVGWQLLRMSSGTG